jgi:hypothetical protein
MVATAALKRITTLTWGASFVRVRLLYNAVVRPTITYGVSAWLEPVTKKSSTIVKKANLV